MIQILKSLKIKNNVPSLCETKEKYKFSDYFVENFVNSRLSVQLKNLKAIEINRNKPKIFKFSDILFTSTWASFYKNSTKSEQKDVQNQNSKHPPHFSINSSSSSSKCSTVIAKIDQKRENVKVKNDKKNQSNFGKSRKLFVTFLNNKNKKFKMQQISVLKSLNLNVQNRII